MYTSAHVHTNLLEVLCHAAELSQHLLQAPEEAATTATTGSGAAREHQVPGEQCQLSERLLQPRKVAPHRLQGEDGLRARWEGGG